MCNSDTGISCSTYRGTLEALRTQRNTLGDNKNMTCVLNVLRLRQECQKILMKEARVGVGVLINRKDIHLLLILRNKIKNR